MKNIKLWSLNTLLYLALILALLSSLGHVAFAFSTVNGGNWFEAYISAIAIDLGLLALAAGINQRKKQGRGTVSLWLGVALFSVISTYANWLAGIGHVTPITANVSQLSTWLVSLRPILLSGVLPGLVIYLSEIVSGNYQVDQAEAEKQAQKEARQRAKMVSFAPNDTNKVIPIDERKAHLEHANDTRQAQIDLRREKVNELLRQEMTQVEIADELGVSIATVKRDTRALNGSANGNGKVTP